MNRKIRVLVVDDEALARRRLLRLLRTQPDVEVVGTCENGPEGVDAIVRSAPDVVFLDVQMPEVDGFAMLSALPPERVPRVVFVTAYSEHALRAFEVGALDYLLKPFDQPRFEHTFARLRADLERDLDDHAPRLLSRLARLAHDRGETPPALPRRDRLMVKTGGRVFFIRTQEVNWVEAADNYVRIHVGREVHLVRQTLQALEAHLDPERFVRIHRGAIVNLDSVREIHPGVSRDHLVRLQDGTTLRLSDRYRRQLEARIGLLGQ